MAQQNQVGSLQGSYTKHDASQVVDRVLTLLRLDKVANVRVGSPLKRGISGGERRRLAIGLELVTQPSGKVLGIQL